MREIKYKAKEIISGIWVKGSLLMSEIDVNKIAVKAEIHERFASDFSIKKHTVDPETVCQFTGLKDKNGNEIYEGDILRKYYLRDTSGKDIVIWNEAVEFELMPEGSGFNIGFLHTAEVIGNKFDNPELLK